MLCLSCSLACSISSYAYACVNLFVNVSTKYNFALKPFSIKFNCSLYYSISFYYLNCIRCLLWEFTKERIIEKWFYDYPEKKSCNQKTHYWYQQFLLGAQTHIGCQCYQTTRGKKWSLNMHLVYIPCYSPVGLHLRSKNKPHQIKFQLQHISSGATGCVVVAHHTAIGTTRNTPYTTSSPTRNSLAPLVAYHFHPGQHSHQNIKYIINF